MNLLAQVNEFAPSPSQRIIPMIVALVIVAVTVELIRRRKLREEYTLLWLSASAVLLVFAIYPHLLILLSRWMGVYYLTTVMLAAFLFLMLLGLRLGMSISHLTDDGRKMAQRIALLEQIGRAHV
jgi:hypothetical protein